MNLLFQSHSGTWTARINHGWLDIRFYDIPKMYQLRIEDLGVTEHQMAQRLLDSLKLDSGAVNSALIHQKMGA